MLDTHKLRFWVDRGRRLSLRHQRDHRRLDRVGELLSRPKSNKRIADLPRGQSHPAPLAITISITDVDPAQLVFTLEYRFHVRPWSKHKPQDGPRPGFEQVHPVVRVRHLVDENRSEVITGEGPFAIEGTLGLEFAAAICELFMCGKPQADIDRVVEDVRLISWEFDALDLVRGHLSPVRYLLLQERLRKMEDPMRAVDEGKGDEES